MSSTKAEIDLRNCEIAFRNAGLYSAYMQLELNIILVAPLGIEAISKILNIPQESLRRFLNALTFLGLCEKNKFGEYQHIKDIIYTDKPTKILMQLIDQDIPHKLFKQPKTLDELQRECPVENLSGLLQDSLELGLLYKNDNDQYCTYNETAMYLLPNNPFYIGPKLLHYKEIMFKTFCVNTIINALKENRSQWKLIMGKEITTPFEAYQDKPELMSIFTKAMHQLNENDNYNILSRIDLSNTKTVLDVGGGSGALAIALAKLFPSLTVDIYEHYAAIELMKNIFLQYATDKQKENINYLSGDFLSSPDLPYLEGIPQKKYSTIFLSWILHDWADNQCEIILKKVLNHLESNSILVIVEELVENEVGRTALSDMTMLLHTQGKERSLQEYKDLLFRSGFHNSLVSVIGHENSRRQLIMVQQV